MNAVLPIDAASARALDIAWLDAQVLPASEYGLRAFAQRRAFSPGEEALAAAHAERIASVASAVTPSALDAMRDVLRRAPDAAGALARATMGETLADPQFLELQRCFDAVAAIDRYLAGIAQVERCSNDAVRAVTAGLEPGRSGAFGFYLADAFDPNLVHLRSEVAQAQAHIDAHRGRAAATVAAALGRSEISGGEFIVMRAEMAHPLPPGVRVVREAATYLLCELDADDAMLDAIARREDASRRVADGEERARERLSHLVRSHAAGIDAAMDALGSLDVLLAQVRFTQMHACMPARYASDASIAFSDGRYLPMTEALALQGRVFTPLALTIDGVAILTGPNMGGKSVALRTCGFIAACAAYGLPVPATNARVALFDDIAWLGIGGEDERGSLLSSFAKEVVRLRDLLDRDAWRRLLLVDEFARTTTPAEGKALLIAVIARLRERAICAVLATHLDGLPQASGARHLAVRGLAGIPKRPPTGNLDEALSALAHSMDYTITEVTGDAAPRSDAVALAALLGLDDALIARAQEAFERQQ